MTYDLEYKIVFDKRTRDKWLIIEDDNLDSASHLLLKLDGDKVKESDFKYYESKEFDPTKTKKRFKLLEKDRIYDIETFIFEDTETEDKWLLSYKEEDDFSDLNFKLFEKGKNDSN